MKRRALLLSILFLVSPLDAGEKLLLSEKTLTPEALGEKLTGRDDLRFLSLVGTKMTDAGMVHVGAIGGLETLLMRETKVTDEGLAHLAGLRQLKVLSLMKCRHVAHTTDRTDWVRRHFQLHTRTP